MHRHLKAFLLLLAALLASFSFVSCSAKGGDAYDGAPSDPGKLSENEQKSGEGGDSEARRLVKTVSLNAETGEFEQSTAWIEESAGEMGGYIGSSKISGGTRQQEDCRIASYVVRIPAERSGEYLALLKQQVSVLSQESSVDDVTGSYTDLQARLSSLTAQEQRVLALLEEATDLDTILRLDDKLTAIRSEIERIQTELKQLENQTSYASITITLREVKEQQEEPSFGQRLGEAFVGSWTDFGNGWLSFFVGFVEAFPTLLILGGIAAAIVLPIRHSVRKKRKRQEELRLAYMQSVQNEGK